MVAVGSFDELHALPAERVRGKIVLYDVPFTKYSETVRYRSLGAKRAASRGAVAALVRSVGPVSLRTPHTGNMSAYVDSFPKIPAAAVAMEDAMMMRRLLKRGERVRVRLEMEADTLPDALSHNVIGELRGRERPDEIVVVGGGAAEAGDLLLEPTRAAFLTTVEGVDVRREVPIVPAALGNEAGAIGAAMLAREAAGA